MPTIRFNHPDGSVQRVEAAAGLSVMEAALAAGVAGIAADCGGALSCATCHVYVAESWIDRLPPAGEDEAAMIEYTVAPCSGSRLSCQIVVTPDIDGLELTVPENQY